MKWYVEFLTIWIILIAVGAFLISVGAVGPVPVGLIGWILVIIGVIVLIIWIVKVCTQFIKNT